MLKEVFKNKLLLEIKDLILREFNKKSKMMDKDKMVRISSILNKDSYSIDDLNDLLIDYYYFSCGRDELLELVKVDNNVDKYILYSIYSYFVSNGNDREIELVLKSLGYKYSVYDVNVISKYIRNAKSKDNLKALRVIEKIWEVEKDNTNEFGTMINNLNKFKEVVSKDLIPYDLVNSFVSVNKCKNFYFQLKNVEDVMMRENTNIKDMLLIYWTYKYSIDKRLEDYLSSVNISKKDVVKFINDLETRGILLDEVRLGNLLKNFKVNYYVKNDLGSLYKELSKKVVREYSNYYDNNFYFRDSDFIKYYNELYNDNFGIFKFSNDNMLLDIDILNSIFECDCLFGDYFLFKDEYLKSDVFEDLNLKEETYLKEREDVYLKRKEFYDKYKFCINEFMNDGNISLKYYVVRNVNEEDRMVFYELFKKLYKDSYNDKMRIKDDVKRMKRDFVLEVLSSLFKERYLIKDKYLEYVEYVGCGNRMNINYFSDILVELENRYFIMVAKDILYRYNCCVSNKGNVDEFWNNVDCFVKEELGLDSVDDVYLRLTSKKCRYLREKYFKIVGKSNKLVKKRV